MLAPIQPAHAPAIILFGKETFPCLSFVIPTFNIV